MPEMMVDSGWHQLHLFAVDCVSSDPEYNVDHKPALYQVWVVQTTRRWLQSFDSETTQAAASPATAKIQRVFSLYEYSHRGSRKYSNSLIATIAVSTAALVAHVSSTLRGQPTPREPSNKSDHVAIPSLRWITTTNADVQ
jgi:hypothetical protein